MNVEFLNFVDELMKANPELTERLMTDTIKEYLAILTDEKAKVCELTENGAAILKFLQENEGTHFWKAKDVAEQMGISSRGVSGSMRKLVSSGFVSKEESSPIIYSLTDKGRDYKFND